MTPNTGGLLCLSITAIGCLASAWEARRFYVKRRKLEVEMAALKKHLIKEDVVQKKLNELLSNNIALNIIPAQEPLKPKIIDNRAGRCPKHDEMLRKSGMLPIIDAINAYAAAPPQKRKKAWWEDVHTMD